MNVLILVFILTFPYVKSNITLKMENGIERVNVLADVVRYNLQSNGWINILSVGSFSDQFYDKINDLKLTKTVTNSSENTIEDIVPYSSNIILLNCLQPEDFQSVLSDIRHHPYWHSLSNIILYYNSVEDGEAIASIFFAFWYYKAINVIVIQYQDDEETLKIWQYSPYVNENSTFAYKFGCWKRLILDYPVTDFAEDFLCEAECHNVSVTSELRAKHLGTCIGLDVIELNPNNFAKTKIMNIFKNRGQNLMGFSLRAYGFEAYPFLLIDETPDGRFELSARDGMTWRTVAEIMNFTIDLTSVRDYIKKPFNFETNVQFVFGFGKRYADLLLIPIYQFDVVVIEVDYSFPYKDSGVCIMSHRAGFETILFDSKLWNNSKLFQRSVACLILLWFSFYIYHSYEKGRMSFDLAGKALLNTVRSAISVTLYKPPRKRSFRIVLGPVIWGYFIINFLTQAAIISFFSSFQRGKDVDTFEDVIEKGYVLEGMASPDILLPDTEERFEVINSKVEAVPDMFTCVERMQNDSKRFCLIDCALGRFLERNKLNDKGQQYLHIARADRIHNYYLNMLLLKHSPLTATFNKIVMRLVEAGLIRKWEQYRYSNIKEVASTNALRIEDIEAIFKCFAISVGICCIIFMIEVIIGSVYKIGRKIIKWNKIRAVKKAIRNERKLGRIKLTHTSIQTNIAVHF